MFRTPKISGWVGYTLFRIAVATWLLAILSVPTNADDSEDELHLHRQSASHMGTRWHIALYSRDTKTANAAFHAAWSRIAEIDAQLSNYSADSELTLLCRSSPHAEFVPAGDHLWKVLRAADQLSRETDGSFDVTIGPVSKLWRRARRKKQLPTDKALGDARAIVGYRFIEYDLGQQAVRLTRPDMQLDFGGIAKGYAVDVAIETLRLHGIECALVNGGGDLAVSGQPPKQSGWTVKVAELNPTEPAKTMTLKDAAIATSGDAWQYVTIQGQRYSHIIDPKTGLGTTDRKSVTVVAENCMTADSLASALAILPMDQGLDLARAKRASARVIFATESSHPKIVTTELFPFLTTPVDEGD